MSQTDLEHRSVVSGGPRTSGATAERVVGAVETAGLVAGALAVIAMTVLMTVGTIMRYLFGEPISWSFSLIQDYLLPGYFFLALAHTYRSGAHVTVDFVYSRCPARVQQVLTVVARLLVLGFALLLLWAGCLATYDVWQSHDIAPPGGSELSVPVWTWQILVPVGALLLTVRGLVDLFTRRPAEPTDFQEGAVL